MRQQSIVVYTDAGDDNGISVSQTPAAGGVQSLTITGALASGGVATLGVHNAIGRQVVIETAADETAIIFTITGTDVNGLVITDKVLGVDTATVVSNHYFVTVTSITVSDDTTGAIIVGTNAVGVSQWVIPDQYISPFNLSVICEVRGTIAKGNDGYAYECIVGHTSGATNRPAGGANSSLYWKKLPIKDQGIQWVTGTAYIAATDATLNYTVKHTHDKLNNNNHSFIPTEKNNSDSDLVSATATQEGNYAYPVVGVRSHINSYTDGALLFTISQAGK